MVICWGCIILVLVVKGGTILSQQRVVGRLYEILVRGEGDWLGEWLMRRHGGSSGVWMIRGEGHSLKAQATFHFPFLPTGGIPAER
jgi:hypothetical protein